MRGALSAPGHDPSHRPVVVRGTLRQTFGGLAVFLAAILGYSGLSLLLSSIANPLTADSLSLLAGAVALALAVMLLICLLPRRGMHLLFRSSRRHKRRTNKSVREAGIADARHAVTEKRRELMFQRNYVDSAWICR